MKFAEIRLNESAPDATGAQTATFRNVDADVEPWGLWVGSLMLPWGSIRYARATAMAERAPVGKRWWDTPQQEAESKAAMALALDGEVFVDSHGNTLTGAEFNARAHAGVSPHDVEKLPAMSTGCDPAGSLSGPVLQPISASVRRRLEEQGAPPEAYEREAQRMAEQRSKRGKKAAP